MIVSNFTHEGDTIHSELQLPVSFSLIFSCFSPFSMKVQSGIQGSVHLHPTNLSNIKKKKKLACRCGNMHSFSTAPHERATGFSPPVSAQCMISTLCRVATIPVMKKDGEEGAALIFGVCEGVFIILALFQRGWHRRSVHQALGIFPAQLRNSPVMNRSVSLHFVEKFTGGGS